MNNVKEMVIANLDSVVSGLRNGEDLSILEISNALQSLCNLLSIQANTKFTSNHKLDNLFVTTDDRLSSQLAGIVGDR